MTQQGQRDSSSFKENRAAPKLSRIRQPKVCYAVAQTSQTRDISEIAPLRARDVNKAADGSFPGLFLFFSSISYDLTAFPCWRVWLARHDDGRCTHRSRHACGQFGSRP